MIKNRMKEHRARLGLKQEDLAKLVGVRRETIGNLEKGRYNPLKKLYGEADYEERMQQILCMMIAESTAEFERLPCLVDVDILRNILYDGVWNRYNKIQMKKSEDQKK